MSRKIGSNEARAHLAELLERASRGTSTVVTRHGRDYAAIVPVAAEAGRPVRISILDLQGTGAGLWGDDSARTLAAMRDEWS